VLAPVTRESPMSTPTPQPNLTAAAALVYSLTELPGIGRVSVRLDERPCYVYDQDGRVIDPVTRALFRGWSMEPCALRTSPDAVPCAS
jgi:hypothetical protein